MQIETERMIVVQLLLKGEDYEVCCPNNEDEWYTRDEVLDEEDSRTLGKISERIRSLLNPNTLEQLKDGQIDVIVCRGNF